MTYLNYVIVYCLRQLNGERSIYSVYHILKGKKSSQSIQDAHLFQLNSFFLSLPNLSRDFFNRKVDELETGHFIRLNEESKAMLTEKGKDTIKQAKSTSFFPLHMDGLKYGDRANVFWRRLNLLVQVLSNHTHKETSYFPVQRSRSIQDWIKNFIREKSDRNLLSLSLHRELHKVLSELEEDPSILVFRLSGCGDYGWTELQTAEKLHLHVEEYRFRFLDLLHGVLAKLDRDKEIFPILSSISTVGEKQGNLTISTAKTFELYKQGHSIKEISKIRKLKVNTIEDHFIEIILTLNHFDTDRFIKPEELHDAASVMEELGTKRLKPIKDRLPHLSYFQIRIAIAKAGDRNGSKAGA
jgi:uncharacterized protein YpbB